MGKVRSRWVARWVVTASLLFGHGAHAADPAAAESLYVEGLELMKRGQADKACPKLEESQRLDPTGATALSLARCFEQLGKVASAWARYQEALDFARKKGATAREREIEAKLATIARDVPKLTIEVPAAVGALAGLVITRAEAAVREAQWNSAIAVDPGTLRITASAPGRKAWASDVQVAAGRDVRVVVPMLEPEVTAPPLASAAPTASSAAPPPPPPPPPPTSRARPDRTLGWVVTGVGAVALGTGTYFAFHRSALSDEASSLCPTSSCGEDNHRDALAKSDEAGRAGTVAVVALSAGVVTTGVGLWLLLRSPGAETALAPWLGPGVAGLGLSGNLR